MNKFPKPKGHTQQTKKTRKKKKSDKLFAVQPDMNRQQLIIEGKTSIYDISSILLIEADWPSQENNLWNIMEQDDFRTENAFHNEQPDYGYSLRLKSYQLQEYLSSSSAIYSRFIAFGIPIFILIAKRLCYNYDLVFLASPKKSPFRRVTI